MLNCFQTIVTVACCREIENIHKIETNISKKRVILNLPTNLWCLRQWIEESIWVHNCVVHLTISKHKLILSNLFHRWRQLRHDHPHWINSIVVLCNEFHFQRLWKSTPYIGHPQFLDAEIKIMRQRFMMSHFGKIMKFILKNNQTLRIAFLPHLELHSTGILANKSIDLLQIKSKQNNF